jgi:hypothetical protein
MEFLKILEATSKLQVSNEREKARSGLRIYNYLLDITVQNLIARNFFANTLQDDLHAILLIAEERNSLNIYRSNK